MISERPTIQELSHGVMTRSAEAHNLEGHL
jgi:hypothetical protein